MGMPTSVLVRGEDDVDAAEPVVAAVYDELRHIDAVFSTYRPDSDICRIRRREITPSQASPLVTEVLALCELARTRTDGWFNVELPGGLDPSGLVKGWAVERALGLFDALPGLDVCLNLAGDIAVRVAPGAPPFVAGIEDPRQRGRLVTTVPLTGGGLATSGTAARGAHVLDPHAGRPATALASISVIGPSLLWADVYATAGFALGRDALAWLGGMPSYDALVVHLDGRVEATDGWPRAGVDHHVQG